MFVTCGKFHLWHWGVLMADEEDEESFTRFLLNLESGLEIGEIQESEPPEPSWCAGSSVGGGWELVEETQTEASSSRLSLDETVVFGNIDNHVRSAFQSLPIDVPKQVWETGVWATVFSDRNFEDAFGLFGGELRRPVSVPLHSDASISNSNLKRKRSAKTYKEVVRHKVDISWREQMDAALQSSVKLWFMLISRWKDDCAIFQALTEAVDESAALRMLPDIFAGRSPYTLRKRALVLMRLCDYLESYIMDAFPVSEKDLYAFLCHERNSGAPVSRLSGYMQAVTFCRYVLDIESLEGAVKSARCKGASKAAVVVEKKQASPLLVVEVRRLHQLLDSSDDIWDRMFSGAAIFCLYCRGRWGDVMRAERVIVDRDSTGVVCYLEARVGVHKTMQAQMHRHEFLPMTAPSPGLWETNWAETWLEVREELQIPFHQTSLVMPAPQLDATAGERPLERQEAAAWLRLLLHGDSTVNPERKVSSHSLKRTMLSYAARRGLDMDIRLQLGYHTGPHKMGLTYSRDGAAASLMALEHMLCEIKTGVYFPDETRSGRLKARPERVDSVVIEIKDEAVHSEKIDSVVQEVPDSETSGDSSTDSEPEEDAGYEPRGYDPAVFCAPETPNGFVMWQHSKSRVLHLMEEGYTRVFVCNRMAGEFHTNENLKPRYDTPICNLCFTRARQSSQ